MSRRDPRLEIIIEALHRLIPGAAPANLTVYMIEKLADRSQNEWSGRPDGLALKIFTALYGRPSATPDTRSPLEQAADAKRARDLVGELGALTGAERDLVSASWYPVRPGDLVHVHYEQAGDFPAFGETYIVGHAGNELMSLKLLTHTCPLMEDEREGAVGCFTAEAADDPLYELWFEAGPQRLTIVRDGRAVHDGGAR
jgi:hypothetical protein